MRQLLLLSFVLLPQSLTACAAPVEESEPVGSASVAITNVPSDVACIKLTATGYRTVTKAYDVVAGASSILAFDTLPTGTVSFRGDAYAGACSTVTSSSLPGWVADSVDVTIASGTVANVNLMMRRNGRASVAVDWEESGGTTYPLTVSRAGTGMGTVTSAPAGINCGTDCTESLAAGTTVTLTAAASAGSTFTGWSGGGCTGTGTCTVTMSAATSVTATFSMNTFTLAVAKGGTGTGTVVSSPAGINCGVDCSEAYSFGTMVTLSAIPATGSTFSGWSGGGCSGTGTCTLSLTASTTVFASFSTP